MPILTIDHVTTYRYSKPVSFGEHRIMMRPRAAHDQRILEADLDIDPAPQRVRWVHDVFGNSVALATFSRRARALRVASRVRLEHEPLDGGGIEVEDYARRYPFSYAAEDMADLLRTIERQHPDPARLVDRWARGFVRMDRPTETLALLAAMTAAIRRDFTYVPRHAEGTQTPVETLGVRQGTCRDFAMLMIEAARSLGLAAHFVSGYVYSPRGAGVVGGGNTHAWVRIFLPGSGWIEYDPTNGIVGGNGLVRVAVARDPRQAVPLSGSFIGFPGSNAGMDVSVDIRMDGDQRYGSGAAAAGAA
ncbi:transglutaminase-like putative cysteine protease [Sphingomonas jejuensis]|uniref:Transglutaminase-like putative cysteine protease n=1 Tax=Sphingomonas jejuensis TaxID=904715 RepID=A0ABX0XL89_9SPHN|nr:transglutaminase family protein [Sphingomonas jejuensis]NJC34000.1 transglutaminase-like putative cysteine protease [Sphingomonas jejuensis]